MKKLAILFCLFTMFSAYSQQIPLSTLYTYNKMMINPAETGLKNPILINLGHRQQWLGFEGAPVTTWLTGQKKLNDNMGIGGSVILDKMSFLERLNINANYSYKVKFNKEHEASFGLSLGMLQSKINVNNIIADDYNDALITNSTVNGTGIDAQFGILYSFKKDFKVGLSFPQMLHNKINLKNSINDSYDLASHWIIYTSYEGALDEKFDLMPTFLIRNADKANRQIEFIANIKYNDKIWGGFGFRQGSGFLINAGAAIKEKFGITYSYELGRSGIANNTGGSHELMLSYKLGKDSLVDEDQEEEIQEPTERKAPTKRF